MTPLLTLGITILCTAIAAGLWACMCGVMFGRFDKRSSWFNSQSWNLKYFGGSTGLVPVEWWFSHDSLGYLRGRDQYPEQYRKVLPQWYYNFAKIRYVERFPFSATILVFFTDFFHLAQWFAIKMICIAIAVNTPAPVAMFFLCWLIWGFGFNIIYLRLK